MKITVLCSDRLHPIVKYLNDWVLTITRPGYKINLIFDRAELSDGDFLFLISCSQIISKTERQRYKHTLITHASNLPKGRGWSPHVWAILNGEKDITVSLFEAEESVDAGRIWLKNSFRVEECFFKYRGFGSYFLSNKL